MANYMLGFPHPLFGSGMCLRGREQPQSLLDLAPTIGQLFDQRFGMTMGDDDLPIPMISANLGLYVRPRHNIDRQQSCVSSVQRDSADGHFQVSLDVNQFQPNELSVKTVENTVVVRGRHEERRDQHGFISREFTRRYELPPGVEPENVLSSLSPEGVLVIRAPKKAPEPAKPNERSVPIIAASGVTVAEPLPAEQPKPSDETAAEETDKAE